MIAAELKNELINEMAIAKVRGFCSSLIYEANQLEGALSTLIQSCGIGPLRPNTLLVPYPEGAHTESTYWYFLRKWHLCFFLKNLLDDRYLKRLLVQHRYVCIHSICVNRQLCHFLSLFLGCFDQCYVA
ncbi:unnamed protein product [Gongylonema pulchrum]|uniref:RUN domain-containing protein n=1 Tax=Gongylonema pulchrum TaxID=637853 RepID=A0A183DEQ3_9BILA|nr:unnamed protein product [Gongylonema pulchrum]